MEEAQIKPLHPTCQTKCKQIKQLAGEHNEAFSSLNTKAQSASYHV